MAARETEPKPLVRCTRCILPETHETIVFDEEGVCNVCRGQEKKRKIDWDAKGVEFKAILDEYRGRYDYDCIVPFSGGKDSTFTLWVLVKHYGLKPLVLTFDHGFMRPKVLENRERTFKKLGVDHLNFRPSWHVVQKLMKESLKRKGDFCWHCHTGIFAYPMQMALKMRIPLIIWGEPSAEYTAYYDYEGDEEVDEKRFNRLTNLGINAEDMLGFTDVTRRDLAPFMYPDVRELREMRVRSICLGSYMPWDVKRQVEVIGRELGWEGDKVEGVPSSGVYSLYSYEKIECGYQGVRDWLKYKKRGYGRTAHLTSIDIRNDRMHRDHALKVTTAYDGKRPASLDAFLEDVGMDEEEFDKIADSHVIAPWKAPNA